MKGNALFEADAVQHLLHFDLIHANDADWYRFAFERATRHRLQSGVIDFDPIGDRPFIVAIGKMILSWRAGKVLQKFDRIRRVLGIFCNRAACDVHVRSPG